LQYIREHAILLLRNKKFLKISRNLLFDRLIDLEPQYNNGRRRSNDFETRGIAYCCRMVSEQLGPH
jgi:hypothetical protein